MLVSARVCSSACAGAGVTAGRGGDGGAGRGCAGLAAACKCAAPPARAITAHIARAPRTHHCLYPRKNSPTRQASFVGNMLRQKLQNAHNKKRGSSFCSRFIFVSRLCAGAGRTRSPSLRSYPNVALDSSVPRFLCCTKTVQRPGGASDPRTPAHLYVVRAQSQLATWPLLLNHINIECEPTEPDVAMQHTIKIR